MKKLLFVISLIAITAGTGYVIYRSNSGALPRWDFLSNLVRQPLAKSEEAVSQAVKNIAARENLLPPPLRAPERASTASLVKADVVKWTNIQRANNGETALTENAKLDQAAAKKLQDMFAKQYFEHISPAGVGPSDLANQVGYKFIMVGENLALGDFKDAQALLDAWMNSPGHRANILNKRYEEIGVAVGRGQFQGETVWLAVQEFGTPLSSCPQPDQQLQSQIVNNNAQLKIMQQQLDEYKSKGEVENYNNLVSVYNNLVDKTKTLVSVYNSQVTAFNQCVSG